MIGYHPHLAPAGGAERFDPFDERVDLTVDPGSEGALQRVTEAVDLSTLGPRAPGRISGVRRAKVGKAGVGQKPAESVRCDRALVSRRNGPEIVAG